MSTPLQLTEEDGLAALREHVVAKASEARAKHGPDFDLAHLEALLADRTLVRYPTKLCFDAEPLIPGEFAWARPIGRRPEDGFELVIHPRFAGDLAALPYLVAYHLVTINYFDVASHREAELFGAALLGLSVDDYYQRLCAYADQLEPSTAGSSGHCACSSNGGSLAQEASTSGCCSDRTRH